MSAIPVDSTQFSKFIEHSKIFDKTRQFLKDYLTDWYQSDAEAFVENMRANLSTILGQYHFRDEFVSITKNFNFEPPMDTVCCTIHISDQEDVCCMRYTAIFDDQLNVIDDYIKA